MSDEVKLDTLRVHPNSTEINGYDLVLTCSIWPEQYDVLKEGEQVGYLRLRSGYFYASYPDCSDDIVYEAEPWGDGCFGDKERNFYLTKAIDAIDKRVNEELDKRGIK